MDVGSLYIDRYEGEKICIGDDVEVFLLKINREHGHVRLVIRAPKHIRIKRGELEDNDNKGNV